MLTHMKKILFLLLFSMIISCVFSQNQWTRGDYVRRIDQLNKKLKTSSIEERPSILLDLSETQGLLGNTVMELNYFKKYVHLRDSLNETFYGTKIDHLKKSHEQQIWELQSDLLAEQIKRKNIQLILSGVIVFLLILLIIDMVRSYNSSRNVIKRRRSDINKTLNPRNDLFTRVSHEIRTPLNGIIGMLEILRQTSLSEKQEEYTNLIAASSNNLLAILNNILDYTTIDPEKITLEDIPFQLDRIVGDVADLMVERTNEKRLKLTSFVDPRIPDYLNGDPMRLRQVLIHLLKNSISTTESGEIFISVEISEEYDNRCELHFSIRDSGRGYTSEQLDELFTLQENAHHIDDAIYEINLGLFISRLTVEKMGGEMGAESTLGVGSNFYFTAVFSKSTNVYSNSALSLKHHKLTNLKVLVVESNKTALNIFAKYLEHMGCIYDLADNSQDAKKLINESKKAKEPYRVLLLAQHIGSELAVDFAKDLKSLLDAKASLILVSSLGSLYSSRELLSKGFHGYLNMPVKLVELFDILSKLCPEFLPNDIRDGEIKKSRPFRSKNVLLVEDNIINEKVARVSLERIGHRVVSAVNGLIALDKFKSETFDLIIMDLQMPIMDGYTATSEIRAYEKSKGVNDEDRIKIVALTANTQNEDKQRCFDAGMDDYIAKPFSHEELLRVLQD